MSAKTEKKFGFTDWGREWLNILESFGWGGRLTRGRSHARNGSVISLQVSSGRVEARVRGNNPSSFNVKIKVNILPLEKWKLILDSLWKQAFYSAKLLAGEMPIEIKDVFIQADAPLYPCLPEDYNFHCSCMEHKYPCRHIASVLYALIGKYDKDPFLLFQLRGMGKEEMMEDLRHRRLLHSQCMKNVEKGRETREAEQKELYELEEPPRSLSLEEELEWYWTGKMGKLNLEIGIVPPGMEGSILKRLGEPSFFAGKRDMMRQLERDYQRVLHRALTIGNSD